MSTVEAGFADPKQVADVACAEIRTWRYRAIMSRAALTRMTTLAVVSATLVALAGCSDREFLDTTSTETHAVRTAPVQRVESAPLVRASGLIVGKEEARLAFKLSGVVEQVLVDEGALVTRGQLLALLKQDGTSSRLAQAQVNLEKAQRDLNRAEYLNAQGVGPLQQVQDAQTAVDIARADLTMAHFNATDARIEAPRDGIVLARLAEPNEMVQPGQAVLQFKSADPGWILRVGLADRDVVRVRLGDRALIRVSALPDRLLEGRVTQIAAAASPTTGTFDVEVSLMPVDAYLLSGMHASAEIQPTMLEHVALVPIDALLEGDSAGATVYVLEENDSIARRRVVEVAFLRDGSAAIREGLDGVSAVVTDGAASLRDGACVRVLPPSDENAAAESVRRATSAP